MNKLKKLLDLELKRKNTLQNLSQTPDPLQIARNFTNPQICLICALFSYGNATQIVKFLKSLNFDLLNLSENAIKKEIICQNLLYRFQNPQDVAEIFVLFKRAKNLDFEEIISKSMQNGIIHGINALICELYKLNNYRSQGYEFFLGKAFKKEPKSPYKRYNMWLRWVVRNQDIDLGLFKKINPSNLIIPLDTHTHKVSQKIGLCKRKSYDFKAALEITENLRKFDPFDPIKYDFAIYRIGQSKQVIKI